VSVGDDLFQLLDDCYSAVSYSCQV